MSRVIHTILVEDERVGQGADFQQAMPIRRVARRRETSKPKTIPACPRLTSVTNRWKPSRSTAEAPDCPRSESITITRSIGQPSRSALLFQSVLALGAFGILNDLPQRRLPNIEIGISL